MRSSQTIILRGGLKNRIPFQACRSSAASSRDRRWEDWRVERRISPLIALVFTSSPLPLRAPKPPWLPPTATAASLRRSPSLEVLRNWIRPSTAESGLSSPSIAGINLHSGLLRLLLGVSACLLQLHANTADQIPSRSTYKTQRSS
ncbi:hypothetical protein ABZP36_031663 [Zizania latifolia]